MIDQFINHEVWQSWAGASPSDPTLPLAAVSVISGIDGGGSWYRDEHETVTNTSDPWPRASFDSGRGPVGPRHSPQSSSRRASEVPLVAALEGRGPDGLPKQRRSTWAVPSSGAAATNLPPAAPLWDDDSAWRHERLNPLQHLKAAGRSHRPSMAAAGSPSDTPRRRRTASLVPYVPTADLEAADSMLTERGTVNQLKGKPAGLFEAERTLRNGTLTW